VLLLNFGTAKTKEQAYCRDAESTRPLLANLVVRDFVSA